ncbi:barstar family protein [Ponticaulis sp.]|uniref:barstar family protein n=1 Tax=Ponticaulis sp. TaxID=2020902 RepID=UPI003413E355
MILEIDGRAIHSLSDFHDRIVECPGVPDFYGRNFYAFRDVLNGFIERPFKIVWRNAGISRSLLGKDFDGLVLMMKQAVEETLSSGRKFEFEIIE